MAQQISRRAHRGRQLKLARAAIHGRTQCPVDLEAARDAGVVTGHATLSAWDLLQEDLEALAAPEASGTSDDSSARMADWQLDVCRAHDAIRFANRLGLLAVAEAIRAGLTRADQAAA